VGAGELVRFLHEEGVTLGVATSAQKAEVRTLLRIAGADGLFDGAGSSDDVDRSKPDPDIVQATLAKLGCSPGEALMVGDTPYDIEAATKADVRTIALRCGGWWDDGALDGAIAIYDNPAELLAHWPVSRGQRPRARSHGMGQGVR